MKNLTQAFELVAHLLGKANFFNPINSLQRIRKTTRRGLAIEALGTHMVFNFLKKIRKV